MIKKKFYFDEAITKSVEMYRKARSERIKAGVSATADKDVASQAARRNNLADKKGQVGTYLIELIRDIGNDHDTLGNPNHIQARMRAWIRYSEQMKVPA